jgi:hypothetical protein
VEVSTSSQTALFRGSVADLVHTFLFHPFLSRASRRVGQPGLFHRPQGRLNDNATRCDDLDCLRAFTSLRLCLGLIYAMFLGFRSVSQLTSGFGL